TFGRQRSSTIRAKDVCSAYAIASSPSAAVMTRCPSTERISAKRKRESSLSSTTRIRKAVTWHGRTSAGGRGLENVQGHPQGDAQGTVDRAVRSRSPPQRQGHRHANPHKGKK